MHDATPRRQFMLLTGAVAALAAAGCNLDSPERNAPKGDRTPNDDDLVDTDDTDSEDPLTCRMTPDDIEGPFYRPDVPVRSNLDRYNHVGDKLDLSGVLSSKACEPIRDAVVEIWHADPDGDYDNSTSEMRYRGQVATDRDGFWSFATLMPGRYLNGATYRPAHIHLKVWRGTQLMLTTQIYFEDDPFLASDPWAIPALTVPLSNEDGRLAAVFDVTV